MYYLRKVEGDNENDDTGLWWITGPRWEDTNEGLETS